MQFKRRYADALADRLNEPRKFIQVVSGPRQVGKTTLVDQVLQDQDLPFLFASADEQSLRGSEWIAPAVGCSKTSN
ncbi:MAG: AAA family ATPase [Candidatus Melainabacteria bacterium]|nr:AAA family ATPase [Candidatus Melainabacteria bacterium]